MRCSRYDSYAGATPNCKRTVRAFEARQEDDDSLIGSVFSPGTKKAISVLEPRLLAGIGAHSRPCAVSESGMQSEWRPRSDTGGREALRFRTVAGRASLVRSHIDVRDASLDEARLAACSNEQGKRKKERLRRSRWRRVFWLQAAKGGWPLSPPPARGDRLAEIFHLKAIGISH